MSDLVSGNNGSSVPPPVLIKTEWPLYFHGDRVSYCLLRFYSFLLVYIMQRW